MSNVVGILIVVVILTQLQVGDALDRLVELDASRLPAARDSASTLEARHAEVAQRLLEAEARRQANAGSLDALADQVLEGSWSCLFPEGDSHDAPHDLAARLPR